MCLRSGGLLPISCEFSLAARQPEEYENGLSSEYFSSSFCGSLMARSLYLCREAELIFPFCLRFMECALWRKRVTRLEMVQNQKLKTNFDIVAGLIKFYK